MNQSRLGDHPSNQQSQAQKKQLNINLKSDIKINMTDCQQKNVIQSQSEYDQGCKQIFKPSVTQEQSNGQVILEKWSKKQVQQFDQDFGQQQIVRDSSLIYEKCERQKIPPQPSIVPHFKQNDWNLLTLHKSQFNVYISEFENDLWIRVLCHDQRQVFGISDSQINMDDLFHLLLISSHIGISSRSNKFKEKQNIIKIDIQTFKSNNKNIYQQILNVLNGMTPEGNSWLNKGSSRVQLKIVGEILNKEFAEFVIGGQNGDENNILLSLVKNNVATETVLFGENEMRSIWFKFQ